ncbi:calcium-activated potassium channel subunit beta-3-like isoform X1 [Branchiostoma lanceolatum]|uniref:calcium-activated potassium channel subunit beta-3-like isoform X1 n=1 Tax=Branchiostoma lanceolatum TaxID=7740 RepID=UPI003455DE6D
MGCCENMSPERKHAVCRKMLCSGMILVMALIIMLGILIVKPAIYGRAFKPTTCTVVSSEYKDNVDCSCGRNCYTQMPCLVVMVTYADRKNVTATGMIHEDEGELDQWSMCSYHSCSRSGQLNYDAVSRFKENYGQVGETYSCFYNPGKENEVLLRKDYDNMVIFHVMFWPSLLLAVLIGITCVICAKYKCWLDEDDSPPSNYSRFGVPA